MGGYTMTRQPQKNSYKIFVAVYQSMLFKLIKQKERAIK